MSSLFHLSEIEQYGRTATTRRDRVYSRKTWRENPPQVHDGIKAMEIC